MAASPAESPLAVWAPSTSPLRIEYSTAAMEEIRARAVEGYYKLMRGGVEVAGLLIGERLDDGIRIVAYQPFEIEYAYGPVFLLSPRDQDFLRGLVVEVDAELADSQRHVVGFYVSHSRGELSLKDHEIALFQEVFPQPWQAVLLLKPSRAPETPAAFFVREADGNVRADRSYLEFELSPHMGERRERPAPRPRTPDASLRALAHASVQPEAPPLPRPSVDPETGEIIPAALMGAPSGGPTPDEGATPLRTSPTTSVGGGYRHVIGPDIPEAPHPGSQPESLPRFRPTGLPPQPPVAAWEDQEASTPQASALVRYAIPAAALFVLLVVGYFAYQFLAAGPEQVVIYTRESSGRMEAVWQLSGIRDATSATVTITNGGQTKTIDLLSAGQWFGSVSDPLLTPDAQVTLDIERRDHPAIHEVARMMGVSTLARRQDSQIFPQGQEIAGNEESASDEVVNDEAVVDETLPADAEDSPATDSASVPVESIEPSRTDPAKPSSERATATNVKEAPSPPVTPSPSAPSEQRIPEVAAPPAEPVRTPAVSTATSTNALERPQPVPPESQPVARTSPPPDNRPALPIEEPTQRSTPPQASTSSPGATSSRTPESDASSLRQRATPAKVRAGRMIWTGQLRKNQNLQITGGDASQGAVNASLPGSAVRLNVLPGELTSDGLVVYTANPRYRDTANAVEEPGPTNGWNRTRYRYDPLRANSIIVTAIPNQTNRWQGVTVRNDDRTVNVIVIDWLADNEN